MTLKEFAILADAIKTYYPKDNMLPTKEAMALWYDALKDLDYKYAEQGLKKYVMSNKFPPAISDIRECSLDFERPKELNEMEAWSLVKKAIKNSSYLRDAVKEFDTLPELIRKTLGSAEQLRSWALDEHYNENVTSSNFMRAYMIEKMRKKNLQILPSEISIMIEKINDKADQSNVYRLEAKEEPGEQLNRVSINAQEKLHEARTRILNSKGGK